MKILKLSNYHFAWKAWACFESGAVANILNEYVSNVVESMYIRDSNEIYGLQMESWIQLLLPSKNTALNQVYL